MLVFVIKLTIGRSEWIIQLHFFELSLSEARCVPFVTQKQQTGINNKLSINISKCCLFIAEMLDPFFMRKTLPRSNADVANIMQCCATYLQHCNIKMQQAAIRRL